jgi:hypothetical protein
MTTPQPDGPAPEQCPPAAWALLSTRAVRDLRVAAALSRFVLDAAPDAAGDDPVRDPGDLLARQRDLVRGLGD